MSASSPRPLPSPPDLDQQRRQAKELLRAFGADDAGAVARVRAVLPDKPVIVLADAQHVLAREYGFRTWAELKRHIEDRAGARVRPLDAMRRAFDRGDARVARELLGRHAELRGLIDEPLFPFDAPAVVHFAARGDAAMVDVLLGYGADPNRRSGWWAGGFHALHHARGAVAELLLAAGAVPDACAAANLDRLDLLAAIIDADPARVHERGGDGQTPLHFARSRAAVDLLLAAGADPDARDVDHRATPAQWMLGGIGGDRRDLAACLVERGAQADIFLAAALGLTDRVEAMLRADPALLELRTSQGEYGEKPPSSFHIYTWTLGADLSPLQVAARCRQTATLERMLEFATPKQRLLAALAGGDAGEARALLRAAPDLLAGLDASDLRLLPDAAGAGDVRAVTLMLELGIDPATPGGAGATALHHAAWHGATDCVAAILDHPAARALIEVREPTYGSTPLGWCCHGSCHAAGPGRDHAGVARLLLDAGAVPGPNLDDASDAVRAAIGSWQRRQH
jgi:ankyrin repeat protein